MSLRRFCYFTFLRLVGAMKDIAATAREVLRALAMMVDSSTGRSCHRFPITIERIAAYTGRSVRTIFRALNVLVKAGIVSREKHRPRRMPDGTFRQPPTSYELHVPREAWRELVAVEKSDAAREQAPIVPRRQTAFASPASLALTVRGKMSTRDAETPLVRRREPRTYDPNEPTADLMSADELAPLLVQDACVAAASCPEERRFVAVASLYELSRRAHEVAGEACELGVSSGRARAAVKQWAARCLANVEQHVESASHAVNVLRRFLRSAGDWERRATGA